SATVSGTIVKFDETKGAASLALGVTAGKNVETVTVDTAFQTTLTVQNAGGKSVSTVDASASVGAVTYNAATTVANVKTGTGNDNVTLATALSATVKSANVDTGEGNDIVTVNVTSTTAGNTVTVDSGA